MNGMKRIVLVAVFASLLAVAGVFAEEAIVGEVNLPENGIVEPIFLEGIDQPVLLSTGTCMITCWGGPGSGPGTTSVFLQTTYQECCSRTIDPCPDGMNPLVYAFNGGKCPR